MSSPGGPVYCLLYAPVPFNDYYGQEADGDYLFSVDFTTRPAPAPGFQGFTGNVASGSIPTFLEPCASGNTVNLTVAQYDYLRGKVSPINTADVAELTAAVCLVWAVAWLSKRAVRVLIPNG